MTNWEVAKIKTQIAIEEGYKAIAMDTGQNTVILHDRGTIDSKAYTDIDTWNKILKDNGWTEKSLGADRYDCVIHLVTAAIGAEQYYTTENNSARRESLEEAKLLDQVFFFLLLLSFIYFIINDITHFSFSFLID